MMSSPFFVSLAIASLIGSLAQAQNKPLDSPEKVDHRVVEMEAKRQGTFFSTSAESDPIHVGEEVWFRLKIRNTTDETIAFEKIVVGCVCSGVECKEPVIEPGKTIEMVVRLKQGASRASTYGVNLKGVSAKGESILLISIHGELLDVLAIDSPPVLEAKSALSTWQIPIIVGAPLNPESLDVELSPELRDMEKKIVIRNGKAFIELTAPAVAIGYSGISGEIHVVENVNKIRASARITFLTRPLARVSPELVTFRKTEVGSFSANFLVQAVDQFSESSSKESARENGLLDIDFKIDKRFQTNVNMQKINNKLWRYSVTLVDKESSKLPEKVNFLMGVKTSLGSREISGLGYFQE
jgi:hypothetical protein